MYIAPVTLAALVLNVPMLLRLVMVSENAKNKHAASILERP